MNIPQEIQSDEPVERISTLEEAKTRMIDAKMKTSGGQFEESDVAARTCVQANRDEWGMKDKQILEDIGNSTDSGYSTLCGRLLVGRVFPKSWRDKNEWATDAKYYSHFERCARTWTKERPDAPEKWLRYCVDNNLSVRGLKAAITLAGDDDPDDHDPVYVANGEWATVIGAEDHTLVLAFDKKLKEQLQEGDRVVVTVVKEAEQ